jgi:hypothetical protein
VDTTSKSKETEAPATHGAELKEQGAVLKELVSTADGEQGSLRWPTKQPGRSAKEPGQSEARVENTSSSQTPFSHA